jgi:hypothetical protein
MTKRQIYISLLPSPFHSQGRIIQRNLGNRVLGNGATHWERKEQGKENKEGKQKKNGKGKKGKGREKKRKKERNRTQILIKR